MHKNRYMVEFAVQQLTGFNLASRGYSITQLAESMGLTADEWELIKPSCEWLSQRQIDELNEYFSPTTTK